MHQKGTRHKSVSYAKYGYLFSLPFIIIFLVFSLYPTLFTAVIGFTNFRGIATKSFHFLSQPFANFGSILTNQTFMKSLLNTVVIWIMNFIPQICLALLLTAWFTRRKFTIHGQGAFKVLFYLPNIITSATIAILFATLFGYPVGPINSLLSHAFYFENDAWWSKAIVAFIQFWMWYGYTTIILISGVLGINPDLFEAAEIDGATPAQTFFRITLPCMRTILVFILITSLIGGLNMFDIPKLFIYNGGPNDATITAAVFIYVQAFGGRYLYDTAAAASMIMFIIIAVLSSGIFFLMRDVYEEREKREARLAKRRMQKLKKGAAA
jgi:multiple sugar transport system permease protein